MKKVAKNECGPITRGTYQLEVEVDWDLWIKQVVGPAAMLFLNAWDWIFCTKCYSVMVTDKEAVL